MLINKKNDLLASINYTETTQTPDNNPPNVTEAYNQTTETTPPPPPPTTTTTTASSLNITEFNSSSTTTSTVGGNVTAAGNETEIHPETTTSATVTEVRPQPNQAGEKTGGDDSLYGYKGEIVLICFTVLFVVLFVMMVVKYHRLKTKFGGYDVGPDTGIGRNNPAYDLQMSYRHGDGDE